MNIPSQAISWWLEGNNLAEYPQHKLQEYLNRYDNSKTFKNIGWFCIVIASLLWVAWYIDDSRSSFPLVGATICLIIIFVWSRLAFRLDEGELKMVQTLISDYAKLFKLCRLDEKNRSTEFVMLHKELQAGLLRAGASPTPLRCTRHPIGREVDKDPRYSRCAHYAWLAARNLAVSQRVAEQEIKFAHRDTTRPDSDSKKKTDFQELLAAAVKTMKKFSLADGSEESIKRMCFLSRGPGGIWVQ